MIGCCPSVDEQLSACELSRLKAFLSEYDVYLVRRFGGTPGKRMLGISWPTNDN